MSNPEPPRESTEVGGPYANYVLFALVLLYVTNFIDRQIPSILAEELKRDLGITDADLGFLYGTAFAIFYAVFGIPLGKVADTWERRKLIAVGLFFWSFMTAASGLARNFVQLAVPRIGVGIGEASASPAAFSMLSDYFSPARRTTALAIYSSGIYIGAGIGLFLGGWITETWNGWYPTRAEAPFGFSGWQVTYFVIGVPGLLQALWIRSLREPVRGLSDGLVVAPYTGPRPLRVFWEELRALLPGFSLLALRDAGAPARLRVANVAAGGAIVAAGVLLTAWLGNPAQWIALGIGLYCAVSWIQGLALRDAPTFALTFRTPSLVYSCLGFSFIAFTGYSIAFFTAPYFVRYHGISLTEIGAVLGLTSAVGGFIGVTLGGVMADRFLERTRRARLYVAIFTAAAPVPFVIWLLTTDNVMLAYGINFVVSLVGGMWIGPGASTIQDLVLPRMRAVASASYLLIITFIGLALGPYTVGRLSVALDDLRTAMILAMAMNAVAVFFLVLAARTLPEDERTRVERARAAGEPGLPS
ncbi:MAG: MFS transporter [Deltaproteobacteria bacterium]|nr:MFS transporter [Deltaproteobacteria bacterium]MBW2413065.1 MFS transporter [Deltaproteobacteria bacterium]